MFGFGSKSADPKELLNDSESSDKGKRKDAVIEMRELDNNYPEIQARLEDLKKNDKDKGVRKEADKSLKELKNKPMGDPLFSTTGTEKYDDPDVPDAKEGGAEGSGFDNQVGDSSLQKGEMDVESDLSKEEEDRREMEAEGKGIFVTMREKNFVTLNHQGAVQSTGKSTGLVEVANSGSQNRINGIDLYLENVGQVQSEDGIEDHTHIGMVKPGERWTREYEYETDLSVIEVKQEFIDPETELSPNFLGGVERQFENRITITNTLDTAITNIRGKKILNENAFLVKSSGDNVSFESGTEEVTEKKKVSSGMDKSSDDDEFGEETAEEPSDEYEETTRTASVVNFTIDEIGAGESVSIVITLEATLPDDVPVYTAGGLSISYDTDDVLTSGLGFKSVDGVSNIRQSIRKRQRDTEPNMYDAEVVFENMSEFVYQIKEFEVREGDINGTPILEWLGADASEDEREIVPGERVVFEFVYDDVDGDGNPSFGQHLEFEVQEYHKITSEYNLDVPAEDLKFMALEIRKAYLDEEGEETKEFEIPSFVETEVSAKMWVTGVGTYPLDNLEVVDEIPEGFRFAEMDQIKVYRNGTELTADQYEISFGEPQGPQDDTYTSSVSEDGETEEQSSEPVTKADLAGGSRLQINLTNLQETEEGSFGEGEELVVEYAMIADLKPQEDPIKTYAYTEGYINDMPDSKVRAEISAEDDLQFIVTHYRDDLDFGKFVDAVEDGYAIELDAENYGSSTMTLTIKDLIPEGFSLIDGSMMTEPEIETSGPEGIDNGQLYTWTFENVEPNGVIKVNYKIEESTENADPRLLNKVYKG